MWLTQLTQAVLSVALAMKYKFPANFDILRASLQLHQLRVEARLGLVVRVHPRLTPRRKPRRIIVRGRDLGGNSITSSRNLICPNHRENQSAEAAAINTV